MNKYIEKKLKGLVQVSKTGDAYVMSVRRFNSDTGDEETPVLVAIDVQSLELSKAALQRQISDIDELLTDCDVVGKNGGN